MDVKIQQQISDIVNKENERIDMKKSKVDNELQTQNRMITLNTSYRKKYSDYNTMYVILITFLSILCGIMVIKRFFVFIPSYVYEILYIILIPIFCIILFKKYLDISKRDDIYYDEIVKEKPTMLTPSEALKKKAEQQNKIMKSGSLLSSYGGCIGAKCCSDTTVWDAGNSVCVAKDGFTTINYAMLHGDIDFSSVKDDFIKPNYPNEFENYSKI
uniref:Uncharacterized protein n=1 Tax=viral metagenome TaxID=1070528 RepID=A0A6C0HBW4_9ZZZZ